MVGGNHGAIRQTPDGADHQDRLAPFANVLAMVSDCYGGDLGRVTTWLTEPQTRLGGRSPMEALETPGRANAVQQWVAGLWPGDGE